MLLLESILIAIPLFFIFTQYFDFIVSLILYVFITPAFIGFLNNFYIYPTIKKYLIDNPNADKSAKDKTDVATDIPAEERTPGGRFENGMWIED